MSEDISEIKEIVEQPTDDLELEDTHSVEIEVTSPIQIESDEHLREVLAKHSEWIAHVLNPRKSVASGRANFRGADLRDFNLQAVNLSGADLRDVNFEGVDLSGSKLTGADLRAANLQNTILDRVQFNRARIDGANFSGASLIETDFGGLDKKLAIFTIEHPETVDDGLVDEGSDTDESDVIDDSQPQEVINAEHEVSLLEKSQLH